MIYRSFPEVPVPYVSCVVDLDGGGTVTGTLVDVAADPENLSVGMPVELVFRPAPVADEDGNRYLSYFFRLRAEAP